MNTYKMKKVLYKKLNKLFKNIFFIKLFGFFVKIKILRPTNKYFNYMLNTYDYNSDNAKVSSRPFSATLNVTNLCNYRCKFCEIHYFYNFAKEKSGKVYSNDLTVEDLKNYDGWLRNIISLELSGASGEPFVSPHFMDVIKYLKKKHKNIILSATTNGSVIKDGQVGELVDAKFDKLLFSIHGGDEETYRKLQGRDINRVFNTIERINKKRIEKGSIYPRLGVNFALNKVNAKSIFNLIDKANEIGIDYIHVQHYYDARNAMEPEYKIRDVSYHYDPEEGNDMLDDIYAYAKEKKVELFPKEPLHLEKDLMVQSGVEGKCIEPWRSFKIKGCVEEEDTAYIGICNRIILFKIKYREFFEKGGEFEDIWNHPVSQFFRETANKNSMCQFCLHKDTRKIRCLDNVKYSLMRDEAVENFFLEFREKYPDYKKIPGLEVLNKNPYKFKTEESHRN